MKNILFGSSVALLLCSCSHNLKFSTNHFAVPVTAETQWGGHASIGASGTTTVAVIGDITSNPPERDKVYINQPTSYILNDDIYTVRVGLDAALSVFPSVEIYADNGIYGVRWQFLNHGPTPDQWVAAVQAGLGKNDQGRSVTWNTSTAEAKSEIESKQFAISVGYKLPVGSVPYVSYIYQVNDVKTKVTNGNTTYPDYHDRGVHQSAAIGMASYHRGLSFAVEYAMLDLDWERADRATQTSLGGNIGWAW